MTVSREVELAEALRDLDAAWSEYSTASLSGWANTHQYRDRLQAIQDRVHGTAHVLGLLEGTEERSHEVVPLGTQEALAGLLAAVDHDALFETGDDEHGAAIDRLNDAVAVAQPLVEGVEPACPKCEGGGKVPDLACADRTLVTCERCHGTGSLGVERTPTPARPGDDLAPGPYHQLARQIVYALALVEMPWLDDQSGIALVTPRVERVLEYHLPAAPSPSGITDEQVEAAHAELLRRPDRLLTPGDVRRALAAALEHQGGERTPDQISLAAVLALVDLRMPDGNPDDGPPAVQGSVARKLDLLRQGIVGLAEAERVGGERTPILHDQDLALVLVARLVDRAPAVADHESERIRKTMLESAALIERLLGIRAGGREPTHALVPISLCRFAYDLLSIYPDASVQAVREALGAGARGGRSVQWPGTVEPGRKGGPS